MKRKRLYFRTISIFGTPLKYGVPVFIGFTVLISGLDAHGGDILRGGSSSSNKPGRASAGAPTPAATDAARANAKDTLARTNRALDGARAMQNAARIAAIKNGANHLGKNPNNLTVTLPKVPNGLMTGGLKVAPTVPSDPTKWIGAKLPTQTVKNGKTKVTIKQTEQQALLNWETFNVGKNTTVTFDQTKGGADVGKWIAFNKVTDPTGNPTQILGNIKAAGQVYLINSNGIIFGGSSQVNARGLTASSLPINENLIARGLLNNPDAQFLFSGLSVPGGADGTPTFDPGPPPAGGKYGDVTVQKGAELTSPDNGGGNGGRIMLVGPNVTNEGTISTEAGQTVLAAGLQVGVAAHDGGDPSLRGLDVWIGAVGDYAGKATNSGIIDVPTGSAWMAGKEVNQFGIIASTTSVNLNGRIDLKASYGAVGNPNFDSTTEQGAGGPMFFNQFTGVVTLGEGSATRILPDYVSRKAVPGTALPERSQVNIEGQAIHFDKDSTLFAPNGDVSVRAGVWPYKDADGNRTIFGADGRIETGITNFYSGANQKFLFENGQIYVDENATISVAGSVDVFVPLAQSILDVELRGSELADSPLQRDSNLRGVALTVDIRNMGTFNGKFWIGTPLGDVTGLAGLIERNAAQLTATGGNINLQAGGSIVVSESSTLDVSGGFFRHQGGLVKTSYLVSGGRLVAIGDATPDQVYDGVFNSESVFYHEKWGVTEAFSTPLFNGTVQESFVEGASGGTLTMTAPSMAIDGELRGITVEGPRQRSTPPAGSNLRLNFEAEKPIFLPSGTITNIKYSPTPPVVSFTNSPGDMSVPEFSLVNGSPLALPADRTDSVVLSSKLLGEEGFGSLEVLNPDGSIVVPESVSLVAAPKGSIKFTAASMSILGSVTAPGGTLDFTTYFVSPSVVAEYALLYPSLPVPLPPLSANRGVFVLGNGARLSTAGLIADDRPNSISVVNEPVITGGGNISIRSYNASLETGSVIDVSGGVFVSDKGAKTYGKGGGISIVTGNDAGFGGALGGKLELGSSLRGYSGSTGGSLSIQAGLIEVGSSSNTAALHLGEDFFRKGGFTKYTLTGIGAASPEPPAGGQLESYVPGVRIAPGTTIRPLAENYIAEENPDQAGAIRLTRFTNAKGLRSSVSLAFNALGFDDPLTIDSLEIRGDIFIGEGSSIATGPGASVAFNAGTVTLLGSVTAPGGTISVAGAGSFPLTSAQRLLFTQALPTVHLGEIARLSVAGTVLLKPDAFGRRVGTVYDGGSISVSGNILAEKGSLLDVSGTSVILDLDPTSLAGGSNEAAIRSGLTSTPIEVQGIATRVDSDGGLIDLTGSQMLLSDATLLGAAGGSTAVGGRLSVSSGRYYSEGEGRTGADINLVVTQNGDVIRNSGGSLGTGTGLLDENGDAYGNHGYFSLEHFREGSFSSLSLGGKYFSSASPVPYGGNVEFRGKIDLNVKGDLRLAAGGVISADNQVRISAGYLAIGQDFRPPQNPKDAFLPFQKDPAFPTSGHTFAPTFGTGGLVLDAKLIDVGTLSLQNIGTADLTALGGDIRGNGTLSMAGNLTIKAAQVYPTTLASFSIFAYDHSAGKGSVTILKSGKSDLPVSAGGNLSIYASEILQNGTLRAPLGSIRLGWDGTDLDTGDSDLDAPVNIIAGSTIATPVSASVTLGGNSVTSVSAATQEGEPAWIAPFGISPDGQTWIDPRGVNVTLSGLPEKSVTITGESVDMKSGSVVDIRGGGDLLASRWVAGNGGSMNLLGSASAVWGGGDEYQPGDLVSFGGETWSARVRHSGQSPTAGLYWSKVAESFAVIPTSSIAFSPYNAFNTGSNAGSLSGDPGYVSSALKVGDTITLDGSDGLPAGTYTLLPRRYALLPGAFIITPTSGSGNETVKAPDGSSLVSGYIGNRFNQPDEASAVRSRFEVASAAVFKDRAAYEKYSANIFLAANADKLEVEHPQQLPGDAGYAGFHGNTALNLQGILRTASPGLGATVDISSFADITLVAGNTSATGIALDTSVLNSWGVDNLLVGGIRRGNAVEVRTGSLMVDNAGGELTASDIVLVSKGELTVSNGSAIRAAGNSGFAADLLSVQGDGALLRVSSDPLASIERSGVTGATDVLMRIGSSVKINGESIILDSTYGTDLAADLKLGADHLTLGSGQISVIFGNATGVLTGSDVSPHLTLQGGTLDRVLQARELTLSSYRSIDFYGSGDMGSDRLETLTLSASALRGYEAGGRDVVIRANQVRLGNPADVAAVSTPANLPGRLRIDARTITLGDHKMAVSGYSDLALNASDRIVFEGTGTFSTAGNLSANTPLITGAQGATYSLTASKAVDLRGSGAGSATTGELGASLTIQGETIAADTDILLPSGQLTLRATGGVLEVGGNLSVEGTSRAFNDLIRVSDAGTITLESLNGDVKLTAGSQVSVAAADMGGNAGTVNVIAAKGIFANAGSLHGEASVGALGGTRGRSGSFLMDVGNLSASGSGSFNAIGISLDDGGFSESRSFRIRNGDVTIGNVNTSHNFLLSADQGSILVTGLINASGKTGGTVSLSARDNLTLADGAGISVVGKDFNSAGKGGSILLEAGTQKNGVANLNALLDLQAGSVINLGVDSYVPGAYSTPGSSAFEGKFTGTLHLRAPRTANNKDVRVDAIESTIFGASSVVVEGFKVYTPVNGVLNIAQRNLINTDAISFLGAAGVGNANEVAMRSKLLAGSSAGLDSLLVIAPGVEMINLTGNLTLGLANNSTAGSTSQEALAAADWDLSGFRYGSRGAAGVLTLRASGDLVFNNTLSDGFTPIAQGTAQEFADNGHSLMWLGKLMTIKDSLPVNTQSWSYRLTAGADMSASNFRNVLSVRELDLSQPAKGSVMVGEFYPAVPNRLTTGLAAGIGSNGQTADTIRISSSTANRGNRFEVIRTGTGDITISAGRDVQLRNQFSTIYTAGVALPTPTTVYSGNDFVVPILPDNIEAHPSQSGGAGTTLGAIQQLYPAAWSMAGGNISLHAQANIGRYTLVNGLLTVDSSRQMPTNWLYRRGFVDSSTGNFANNGGFGDDPTSIDSENVQDAATSTTWWVDYSNFFQGIGALGGGNVNLTAGNDIVNVDAVTPTNARMPGRMKNPDFGVVAGAEEFINVAPDARKLLELGGGDVTVSAGRNIDGGVYYVERGKGILSAGGAITTNAARSPSLGILNGSAALDSLTWLPTTLFVGKSNFDVTARGDVLLGPVTNPFLLPQGLNNKYWYKSYFNTFSADAGATVASYGGSVTHRLEVNLPGGSSSTSILGAWFGGQNLFSGAASSFNASNFQPWLRLSELDLGTFSGVFGLGAPNLRSTAFGGDVNLAGSWTLFPSATANLELAAAGSIVGLQPTGPGNVNGRTAQVWTSSTLSMSDASPESIPGIATPLAYQSVVGRSRIGQLQSAAKILQNVNLALAETGSYSGLAGTSAVQQALHDGRILHQGDSNPVKIYAASGDISGFTLFTPKAARIIAERDITDVAFYLQNISVKDISLVSAGRDIVPFNESAPLRSLANNLDAGNFVGDSRAATVTGDSTSAMAGDIQINGPGVLEVLSGRNLDLGTGANFVNGTGVGITSIGNNRNPNLPFGGADIIALGGVTAADGEGPALGLSLSSMDFESFVGEYLDDPEKKESPYWRKVGKKKNFNALNDEQQAIVALGKFYQVLRDTGRAYADEGNYRSGYEAVRTLFGKDGPVGEILTRAREIRTTSGGSISLGVPGGGITMASEIFGNPLTPPGIVTEYGGTISTFTDGSVDIGQARIFTLRGGDITMWSSKGNIAAGTSPRTVVTAPPTRVVIDINSADVQTDLGGLATGGGIGVLAAVEDVKPGNVDLIAPKGFVDAGDAGIQSTGNLTIAAQVVLNAGNISSGGTSTGTSVAAAAAPSVATVTAASNNSAAAGTTANKPVDEQKPAAAPDVEETLSIFTVEVIGYGGGGTDEEEEEEAQPQL